MLFCQSDSLNRPPDSEFKNAANRWQITHVPDARTQRDTVTPEIRATRNTYWEKPLENLRGAFVGGEDYLVGVLPEFPDTPDSIWIVATFEDSHVYAIDRNNELLYTELNFRVRRVLKKASDIAVIEGDLLDVGIPGGEIISPTGKVLSFQVHPHHWDFRLNHTYLVQFFYQQNGAFFSSGKEWDVTSGKVEPDIPPEKYRAEHGQSVIDGMTLDAVEKLLPVILSTHANNKSAN